MHRRLCVVAIAAVLMAGVGAGHIINGSGQAAQASTVPGGRDAGVGVVTPVNDGSDNSVDDASSSAAATSGGSRLARAATASKGGVARGTATTASGSGTHAGPGGGSVATGPLRALASRKGISVGAAVRTNGYLTDSNYSSLLSTEYNMLTPENEMKWSLIHPQPGVYSFAPADVDVSFAQSHGMAVRGHNLAWYADNPAWLTTVPYTRDQLISILHDHIATVVGHYRGQVAQWDVVNEPLAHGFWWDHIGPEYIDMAFRWAHEADPAAKLFVNESGAEGLGPASDAIYNLVRGLKQRGVPVDGVGLESHFDLNPPSFADIAANMRRLNGVGVQAAFTEVDVRLRMPASAQDLERQRVIYSGLLATCVAAPNCKTFASWGFTDRVSWVSSSYPGYGAALPFDENYAPKPAYFGLRAALGG